MSANGKSNDHRTTRSERWNALMSRFRRHPARQRNDRSERRQTVPLELAGKWVAWSPDGLRILLSGDTFREVCEEAERLGYKDVVYEGIPKYFRNRGIKVEP
ncbi:MAG: hypothetical protein P4L84_03920 [Isosphaeraceae bacterium]|nr:hypothetical protein [Isosphaeraceae bacterium]